MRTVSVFFGRLIIGVHFHRLGVEQQLDDFEVVRAPDSQAGLKMNFTFLFAAMFAVRRRLRPCETSSFRVSTCFSSQSVRP